MEVPVDGVTIRAWKPPVPGIREVFHARFTDHAYPPHTHDTWTVFIVDAGAIRYDLDRRACAAEPPMVTVLPPHVVHDGRPATGHGFRKRVLYLETSVLGERLIGPAVDRPVVPDRSLRRDVSDLHDALACIDDAFEAETRLTFVAERIRESFGEPVGEPPGEPGQDLAERLRAFLDARLFEPVTMAAASEQLGAGPTQLARAFSTVFGIAPHAYLLGRRLDTARDRILGGQPLADVAADVGFYDQAHLTRRFKRFLGTTPGRFASPSESGRLVPSRIRAK
jgi:AraC-like DNA-binding protein